LTPTISEIWSREYTGKKPSAIKTDGFFV